MGENGKKAGDGDPRPTETVPMAADPQKPPAGNPKAAPVKGKGKARPVNEVAAALEIPDYVLVGVKYAYRWSDTHEVTPEALQSAVDEWLSRPHGRHLTDVANLHTTTANRAKRHAAGARKAAEEAKARGDTKTAKAALATAEANDAVYATANAKADAARKRLEEVR
jgi:hypothetical protein